MNAQNDSYHYLQGILNEITTIKGHGGKGLFRVKDEVLDECVAYMVNYFKNFTERYEVKTTKCARCSNTWEIMIIFKD